MNQYLVYWLWSTYGMPLRDSVVEVHADASRYPNQPGLVPCEEALGTAFFTVACES